MFGLLSARGKIIVKQVYSHVHPDVVTANHDVVTTSKDVVTAPKT